MSSAPGILIIDDERGIRSLCSDVLRRAGYDVEVAESGEAGVALAGGKDLVFCDINLPGIDGLQVLQQIQKLDRSPTVVLITAYPSVETAVRGMKLGARDYITKPFTPDELRMVARRALDEDALRRENQQLRGALAFGNLIGESPAMLTLRETITKVARSDATVLVTGKSGTGKELVARAIHFEGERRGRAFVPVNCGALVGSLLESELFGHVRGAFTGADTDKQGLFVAASGGTLMLDEVGELPLELQPKLLRALQEGEIKRVGGVEPEHVDTRVIAATNRDLGKLVREGRFREDLFYRLNVITIEVPSLAERASDIPLLADHFVERIAQKLGAPRYSISDAGYEWLQTQPWPGNIRELENAIERAVVLASGPMLHPPDFKPVGSSVSTDAPTQTPLVSLEELERLHILRVLGSVGGQKTRAATILGINRTTLWKKLRHYGVE